MEIENNMRILIILWKASDYGTYNIVIYDTIVFHIIINSQTTYIYLKIQKKLIFILIPLFLKVYYRQMETEWLKSRVKSLWKLGFLILGKKSETKRIFGLYCGALIDVWQIMGTRLKQKSVLGEYSMVYKINVHYKEILLK